MGAIGRLVSSGYGALMGNVAARVAALGSIFVATLLVARAGGPELVGVYALLHVLPSLVGMVVSLGLVGAVAYFLAGPSRDDRRLPLTIVAMALASGAVGAAVWAAAVPVTAQLLFPDLSPVLVAVAGLAVATRLVVTTAKSCSQGSHDLAGASRVILTEELAFLPAFAVLAAAGVAGETAVVAGLLLADTATGSLGWARLVRKGFFSDARRPSYRLARRVASYGLKAQTGTVISQLNLRLDFVIISVLTGPAVLGIYAIASKFAELTKVLGMAITYVLYPRFAQAGAAKAAAWARRLIPRAALLTAVVVVPLFLAVGVVIPAVYGSEFEGASTPARIILFGLVFEGVAAVITAFLYGAGRPGLYSLAMGAGLVVTVILDVILIPRYEEIGAAVASAASYGTSTAALVWLFVALRRHSAAVAQGADSGARGRATAVFSFRWKGGVSAADRPG